MDSSRSFRGPPGHYRSRLLASSVFLHFPSRSKSGPRTKDSFACPWVQGLAESKGSFRVPGRSLFLQRLGKNRSCLWGRGPPPKKKTKKTKQARGWWPFFGLLLSQPKGGSLGAPGCLHAMATRDRATCDLRSPGPDVSLCIEKSDNHFAGGSEVAAC